MLDRRFSVAPMMDCTDRHDRYFLRLIAPHILLYTEMITTGALLYGDTQRFLAFHPLEHPVALQLGGNDPKILAQCALVGADFGYDEINLNVGCPSSRVKSGQFGACLMRTPDLVAECIAAMRVAVSSIPITVKCRIGVDEEDSYDQLSAFIKTVAAAGCTVFIIHARKAWLNGLSPKQNRNIPPLRYEVVQKIKQDFPQLTIIMNGGIKKMQDVVEHLTVVDGVMIGREAYANPYFLADIEKKYFSAAASVLTRHAIIEKFIPYVQFQLAHQIKLSSITRHILGLFQGQRGARLWRRHLSEHAYREYADIDIIRGALQYVRAIDEAS